MQIKPGIYGFLVLLVFFGTILGFQSAGIWSVSGKVTSSGEAAQPLAEDVNTIKGWMTLDQVMTTYNVPLAEIVAHFELPADTTPDMALKDLENDLFSVTNLRIWLQERTASPEAVQPTEVPVVEPTPTVVLPPAQPAASPDESANTITGKTTFAELLDWGISKENLQTIIGGELPADLSMTVKDYVTQQGTEFSTAKGLIQAELDKK